MADEYRNVGSPFADSVGTGCAINANRPMRPSRCPTSRNSPHGCCSKCHPVVTAPAEHTPHRMQRQKTKQRVEGTQLSLFELDRVAARTFASYPKYLKQPTGPVPTLHVHFSVLSEETFAQASDRPFDPRWSFSPTRRVMHERSLWPWPCRNPPRRNKD